MQRSNTLTKEGVCAKLRVASLVATTRRLDATEFLAMEENISLLFEFNQNRSKR